MPAALQRRVDAAVAALLMVAALAQVMGGAGTGPLAAIAVAAIPATVAFRRTHPELAVLAGLAAGFAYQQSGDPVSLAIGPLVFVLDYYALGRRSTEHRRPVAEAALVALAVPFILSIPEDASVVPLAAVLSFFVLAPFAAGRAIAGRSALAHELAIANARLEDEQRDQARRATVLERSRIARELHDVIAHSVSLMVIQAGAARSVARDDPPEAHEALRAVEAAGRDALAELRQIVGVLARDDTELGRVAMPGLAQLDALVARARASGLDVDVLVEGEPCALAPALDLVAYRVVQEALTNTLRHAGPAHASVRVAYAHEALELDIADTGCERAGTGNGGGHGLIGMRERLAMVGGEMRAGQRLGGGFEVFVRLPLAQEIRA